MKVHLTESAAHLLPCLQRAHFPDPQFAASAALWLEACGYPGLQQLAESLEDPPSSATFAEDVLGLDLKNVSCARIGPAVIAHVLKNGRTYLRNVRHGLFLVPASVEHHFGIGCPIDPAFALGGERLKNPYVEKIEVALKNGIEVDQTLWSSLTGEAL